MTANTHAQSRRRGKRIAIGIGALLLLIIIAGIIGYRLMVHHPSDLAVQAMQSDTAVTVSDQDGIIRFEPTTAIQQPSVLFYPGAFVNPKSYSPWAHKLAEAGYRTYIVRMPLNLAVMGMNKANPVIEAHPDETFVLGGHSLGGAMAARYAAEHADQLAGVFFMGAYADDKGNLAATDLQALQLTASQDGVLSWDTWEQDKKNMPEETTYVSIEGGNHAQFGSYGTQRGDLEATISETEQHEQIVNAMVTWLEQMNSSQN